MAAKQAEQLANFFEQSLIELVVAAVKCSVGQVVGILASFGDTATKALLPNP